MTPLPPAVRWRARFSPPADEPRRQRCRARRANSVVVGAREPPSSVARFGRRSSLESNANDAARCQRSRLRWQRQRLATVSPGGHVAREYAHYVRFAAVHSRGADGQQDASRMRTTPVTARYSAHRLVAGSLSSSHGRRSSRHLEDSRSDLYPSPTNTLWPTGRSSAKISR